MPKVKVKDSHLNFNGVNYYFKKAENMVIGSYGEKETQIRTLNGLDMDGAIKIPAKMIEHKTSINFNQIEVDRSFFDSAVNILAEGVPVEVNTDVFFENMKDGKYHLSKYAIMKQDLIKWMNKDEDAIDSLIRAGKSARVVHEVFVIESMEESRSHSHEINGGISMGTDRIGGRANGGTSVSRQTDLEISEGTVFAYNLAKLEWDAKQEKKKTKVVDLDDEPWG